MKQLRDLTQKTYVITGATSGIGLAAAKALTKRGAFVIGVGRSSERCQQAANQIKKENPDAQVSYLTANLASQKQVRGLAHEIIEAVERSSDNTLHALINNAGTVSTWYHATEDGYELQFAVNHLAPFLLSYLLMALLSAGRDGRIVTVSSSSHYRTRIQWKDVMYRKNYHCLLAYKQSKLANVLFSAEFNRRMADTPVRAFAADPGLVKTDIGLKGTSGIEYWFWRMRMAGGAPPEVGAETIVHLATHPSISDTDAVYWKDCKPKTPSSYAEKRVYADRFWQISEKLCGISWKPEPEIKSLAVSAAGR